MGLLDKLKNVFFEEEYIEVEEPVKKEKVTVAKKIETPEVKRGKEEVVRKEKELEKEPVKVKEPEKEEEHDFKFPMNFDDNDFEVEERVESPLVRDDIPTPPVKESVVEEKAAEKIEKKEGPISDYHATNYQGLYEGSERKDKNNGFRPSPIISPIYGILDKNYRKEEIVAKKEIRLSATSNKKVDLDTVREKAYGDLASEITASIHEEVTKEEPKVEEENLLYDLSEEESPAVKVVTVGDAEEYFNDLGLEYNVDYKVEKRDATEEKPVTRRVDKNSNREKELKEKKTELKEEDSNLFDLIDSMYEDKE